MIMSCSLTSTPEKSSVVHLSPKRRRDDPTSKHGSAYTSRELHSWTFSTESIACCTINDALTMKQNMVDGYDFFWLGRIPCRSVEVVGIVVGLRITESKIVYSVDDGTGVIDCNYLQRDHPAAEPLTKQISKYQRPETDTLPELPKPIADIGQTIRVIGTVRPWYESRIISVNHLHLCASPNEELLHSKFVRERHRTWYSSETPFILPSQSTKKTVLETPIKKKKVQDVPSTGISNAPSSVSSSPIKSSPLHEETKGKIKSPPKLRHPSRLHTHDLTENTFRIYIKHYMDHATTTPHSSPDCDSDDDEIAKSLEKTPSTPTKRSRPSQLLLDSNTPRPTYYSITTPKTSRSKCMDLEAKEPRLEGFTLSYLRRVPELSLLATRVVQAVAKRRQREERKRRLKKEAGVISSSKPPAPSPLPPPPPPPPPPIPADKFAGKVKRLFQWAVIQLLREGCIILWDGPVRRFPDSKSTVTDISRLWKTCIINPHGDCTIFSASLPDSSIDNDSLSSYLSDPQPNEESYVSLTPAYLAPHVEQAVKVLVEHYERIGKPYAGATTEGILSVLKKKDDRWRYVGAWSVQDALETLRTECKVWDMGKGRWDLTV